MNKIETRDILLCIYKYICVYSIKIFNTFYTETVKSLHIDI